MFFSLLKSSGFFFCLFVTSFLIIKHTIQSEQRIQLLTKYKQIQREGRGRGGGRGGRMEGEEQKCTIEKNEIAIFQCRKIRLEGSEM